MDSKNKSNSIQLTYEERMNEVIKNIIKMLIERKKLYNTVKFDEFYNNIINNNDIKYNIIKFTLDNINYVVKFMNISSSGKKFEDLEQFITTYKNEYKFLIINDNITQKKLDDINNIYNLEVFVQNELLINIIEHELVPKHRLLTNNEKELFLNENDVKIEDLSRIYVSDPIARYYKAKIGDIMEIERITPNSGKTLFYRIVSPGTMQK